MANYNTLVWCLKRDLLTFSEKISEGLFRPMQKFTAQMLYGILASQSSMLSSIGRALQENITLKKTEDRLSRNLSAFHQDSNCVFHNYLEIAGSLVDEDTIFCVDPGDITKRYSRCQEGLSLIHDGSEHKSAKGWYLYEITALTHSKKLPLPVYSKVVSADDTDGQTEEILDSLREKQRVFGNVGIDTMDRGMDNDAVYEHELDSKQKFIIRNKVNRHLITDVGIVKTSDIAETMKGKYRIDHTDKHSTLHHLKVSCKKVCLPSRPNEPLTLIIVYGYDKPMLLLTNLPVCGKQTCLRVVKTYLCRWRIEECYRFQKDKFDLENIRVMSMDSIRSMVCLLSILSGYLAMFANKRGESMLLEDVFHMAKPIHGVAKFSLYAVADGIRNILKYATRGIGKALTRTRQSQQLSLFDPSVFNVLVA